MPDSLLLRVFWNKFSAAAFLKTLVLSQVRPLEATELTGPEFSVLIVTVTAFFYKKASEVGVLRS